MKGENARGSVLAPGAGLLGWLGGLGWRLCPAQSLLPARTGATGWVPEIAHGKCQGRLSQLWLSSPVPPPQIPPNPLTPPPPPCTCQE